MSLKVVHNITTEKDRRAAALEKILVAKWKARDEKKAGIKKQNNTRT